MSKSKEQKAQEKAQRKVEKEAELLTARNQENAGKINAQNLGRIARDIKECTSELEKTTILVVQARKYKTSRVALGSVLEQYITKVKESGKLETRIAMLTKVQNSAFRNCAVDNAILALDDIPSMSKEQLLKVVTLAHSVKTELVNLLHSSEGTTSPTQGYCAFIHSPIKNLFTDDEIEQAQFYLVSQGWDGKRNFPYYGVRMTPSDNPKNTKEIHCEHPSPEMILSDWIPPVEVIEEQLTEEQSS